ncbi:MAG: endonuclease I [Cryomorphaceae bacterium]|jgi:endonuclease I
MFWLTIYFALNSIYLSNMKSTITLLTFCFLAMVSGAQIQSYYNGLDFDLTGPALQTELSNKISSNVSFLNYTSSSYDAWDALQDGDQNPDDGNEVLLLYGWESGQDGTLTNDRERGINNYGGSSGDWNREHVFARSLAVPALTVDDPGPGTDILNLRPCDEQTNQTRSNFPFADGSGNGGFSGGGWYPGDEWKGDVARIVLYMYLRYDGDGSSSSQTRCLPSSSGLGPNVPSDSNVPLIFLEWNAEDPVSEVEMQKNEVTQIRQGNRNPFIDNPILATLIWDGPEAEDIWGLTEVDFALESQVFPNGVLLTWTAPDGAVGCEIRGGGLGGNDPRSITVVNSSPDNYFVSENQLGGGGNFQWKVRCATGINPVSGITDFSDYNTFNFGSGIILQPNEMDELQNFTWKID